MDVVIPTQTIGFYNSTVSTENQPTKSCHTYPNDRLLQPQEYMSLVLNCCHTPPNERLLQQSQELYHVCGGCHTPPNERLLQLNKTIKQTWKVVIPLQTKGFYNSKIEGKYVVLLSYPSKRKASTTDIDDWLMKLCCHTPPNERLLQQPLKIKIMRYCCHTPPNERLLQLKIARAMYTHGKVVISPQTKKLLQLANLIWAAHFSDSNSCHTSPNDRLLHLSIPAKRGSGLSPRGIVLCVVIPIIGL